jgi:putative membrane protein
MSMAFPFWTYPEGGFFFGMPFSNWLGWFGVSLVIMAGFEFLGGGRPQRHPWAIPFFVVNCAFPFLLSVLYGYPTAALYGIAATAAVVLIVRTGERRAHVSAG